MSHQQQQQQQHQGHLHLHQHDHDHHQQTGQSVIALEIENIELQATVDSQEELINRISDDLRNVHHDRDFVAEMEILDRNQQCIDLREQLSDKDSTIQFLKGELVQSSNLTEEVYKKYEG